MLWRVESDLMIFSKWIADEISKMAGVGLMDREILSRGEFRFAV